MYKRFFQLKENPFNMTPDPTFMYCSKRHMELLSSLQYGVEWQKGFIEITGEIGTGKSTVTRLFLDSIKDQAHTALVLNPYLSEIQLLQTIVEDFGITVAKVNKKALFDALNSFLFDVHEEGSTAVLIIDEAQNLSVKALEQIRLISNLETQKQKLIQIILVGQPELREHLQKPALKQLRQRMAIRYHLTPLDRAETEEYVVHRLRVAGAPRGSVTFTAEAITRLYRYSEGVPRLINVVCDKVLLLGYVRETKDITGVIVEEAIREIEGVLPTSLKNVDAFIEPKKKLSVPILDQYHEQDV